MLTEFAMDKPCHHELAITLHYKNVTRTAASSNLRATPEYGHGEPDALRGRTAGLETGAVARSICAYLDRTYCSITD